MSAFEKRFRRHRRQNPGELGHPRDIALPEERPPLHVETAGQKVQREPPAICPQRLRIIDRGESVIIGDEIKGLVCRRFLERDRRPHHPEIISDMKNAGGLNAGKNAHDFRISPRDSSTAPGMTNGNGSPTASPPRRIRPCRKRSQFFGRFCSRVFSESLSPRGPRRRRYFPRLQFCNRRPRCPSSPSRMNRRSPPSKHFSTH